jgi:hypothetical protein
VGVDPLTSKRQYVTRTIRGTRRDAEVECTKLLRQIDEGAVVPRAGTIGELVEAWYGLRSNNLSPGLSGGKVLAEPATPLLPPTEVSVNRYHACN